MRMKPNALRGKTNLKAKSHVSYLKAFESNANWSCFFYFLFSFICYFIVFWIVIFHKQTVYNVHYLNPKKRRRSRRGNNLCIKLANNKVKLSCKWCFYLWSAWPLSLRVRLKSEKCIYRSIDAFGYVLRIWLFVYYCARYTCLLYTSCVDDASSSKRLQRANDLFVHYISLRFSIFFCQVAFYDPIHTFIFPAPGEWYMRTNIFANMFCGYV